MTSYTESTGKMKCYSTHSMSCINIGTEGKNLDIIHYLMCKWQIIALRDCWVLSGFTVVYIITRKKRKEKVSNIKK